MLDKISLACYIVIEVMSVSKRSILRLLLICALAAVVYLADMYALLAPVQRINLSGDGTGVSVEISE